MPRPSKHVSPDTLGGRIRAAREHLQLSLAEVADGQYSTSLISQIERNRIEPSDESLRFLAERLQLSLEDLEFLAQQSRIADFETRQYKPYEDLRNQAAQLFADGETSKAMELLADLHFPQIPAPLRWRLAALRGQCYFAQRKFLKAQQDFMYAANEHPRSETLPSEQRHELMLMHLHFAGTYRELRQFDDALEQYKLTLQRMNRETPFGYVAEVHWGIALIAFAQASSMHSSDKRRERKLRTALEHAENSRFLYRAINEQLRAAAVTCQIAQIEQMLGNETRARAYLEEVLDLYAYNGDTSPLTDQQDEHQLQEEANVISAAACSLASIELEAKNYKEASEYADLALDAGMRSYPLRRADAYLMRGRILESIDSCNPEAEEAFRHATRELADTQRIAARISAHVRLGRHLLKIGKIVESELELEQARLLSDMASSTSSIEDDTTMV